MRPNAQGRLLTALGVFLALLGCTRVGSLTRAQNALAARAIGAITASDYDELVAMMHFPPSESPAQRSADIAGVRDEFRVIAEDFGSVTEARPVAEQPNAAFIGVSSGTLEYWSHYPKLHRYVYGVNFERRQGGWVFIDISEVSGKSQVRAVWFALPKGAEKTSGEIASTGERLVGVVRGRRK